MEAVQPPAPQPARKGINVGTVINEAASIYRDNVGALIGSAIAVFVVFGLISGLLRTGDGVILGLLGAIVSLAGQMLYAGFVVRLVEDVRDGRRDQTVGDLFSAAAPSILPLIAFGILFGFGVGIGLLLVVIPGLILITFWSVGAPAIVAEGAGPIEAFGRSWNLVKGEAWSVFATLIVVLVIVIVVQAILQLIGAAIGDGGLIVAAIIAAALTAPIFALTVSVMFFDLGGGQADRTGSAGGQTAV